MRKVSRAMSKRNIDGCGGSGVKDGSAKSDRDALHARGCGGTRADERRAKLYPMMIRRRGKLFATLREVILPFGGFERVFCRRGAGLAFDAAAERRLRFPFDRRRRAAKFVRRG